MRIIPVNVYKFNELFPAAQERVRNFYLENVEPEAFEETCEDLLGGKFPNSDLHVQFCLSCCQGDGLNIYGILNLFDALNLVRNKLTPEEQAELTTLLSLYSKYYDIPSNRRYTYCICDRHDYTRNLLEDIEYSRSTVPYDLLRKFNTLIQNLLTDFCRDFEKDGYSYFYEVEDSDLEDWCKANEYEFYANGELV